MRTRLLDAARDLLASEPDASLTEIAYVAGIGRATAYRHFDNLAALHTELLEQAAKAARDELLAALACRRGQRLTQWLPALAHQAITSTSPHAVLLRSIEIPGTALVALHAPPLRALILNAQRQGEIRGDLEPSAAAELLLASFLHAARRVHAGSITVDAAMDVLASQLRGMARLSNTI